MPSTKCSFGFNTSSGGVKTQGIKPPPCRMPSRKRPVCKLGRSRTRRPRAIRLQEASRSHIESSRPSPATIRTSTYDVLQSLVMSDTEPDEPDSPKQFGPNSRRRTFDSGAEPPQEPAPSSKLKAKIQRIIDEVVTPKGTYTYQELASSDEIRVLRLLKGRREDKIECTLIPSALISSKTTPSTSTAKTLQYQALSYCWGTEEARTEITINSFGKSDTAWAGFERHSFFIRSNLEAALRQIRSQKHDLDIWVDAICMNQNDKKEKTAQVARMHDIYAEAESVCVWLGAGVPETASTFKFLKEILNLQRLDDLIKTEADKDKWWLIFRLMGNRWFSRRWVIQELALARTAIVRWGKEKLPWAKFADAIALFITKHDEIKQILQKTTEYPYLNDPFGDARALGPNTLVNATNNLFRKSEDGKIQQRLLTLEMLVSCHFLAFEAKDPRDTIFAVLSIAKDTTFAMSDLTARTSWMIQSQQNSNGFYNYCKDVLFRWLFPVPVPLLAKSADDIRISPDYDKSLVDVCADFMDYCIETSQSLDIICRHWAPLLPGKTNREKLKPGAESEVIEELPSWVPSIKGHAFGAPEDALQGRSNGDSFVGTIERQNQQHYNAAAGLLPWVEFGRNPELEDLEVLAEDVVEPSKGEHPKAPESSPPRRNKFDGTLFIKGFRMGEIANLTGRVSRGMIQHEAFEMCGLKMDSQSQAISENILDKVPDQLWRTLVADRGPNGINAPSWYHRACLESLRNVDQSGDLGTSELINTKKMPTTIVSFLDRVQRVVWNRKFFQSADDSNRKPLFGLAPPNAKMKDIICIIFGCSVPVLLREFKYPGETYFELVGECYVHGYMDGEAIHRDRPKYPYPGAEKFNLR